MSGAKHDSGKVPLDLLPPRPLVEIAQVLDFGRKKYGAYNWSTGFAVSRLFSALLRHVWAWWTGEESDPETGLSHLAHAGCCLLFIMDLRHSRPAAWQDDRPVGVVAPAFERPNELG